MSIGYKPANEANIESRLTEINIASPQWKAAKNEIINIILKSEGKTRSNLSAANIEQWEERILPVMDVRVENFETVKLLRASNLVRYAEPMGYEPKQDNPNASSLSSSGCGNNVGDATLVAGTDYTTITPNTKQSWNYTYHNIPAAWTKSTGAGIKVFIIDSGCELDQENLGSAFNQGSSSGRTVEKIVTLPRSTFLEYQLALLKRLMTVAVMVLQWLVLVLHQEVLMAQPVVLHTIVIWLPVMLRLMLI